MTIQKGMGLSMVIIAALMLIITPVVAAQDSTRPTSSMPGQGSDTAPSASPEARMSPTSTIGPNAPAQPQTTATDRIAQRKEAAKLKLTNAQQTRIKARCAAAQNKLKPLSDAVTKAQEKHGVAFSGAITKLEELQKKLAAQNIATTELEAQIIELRQKVSTYETTASAYSTAVADASSFDCTTDPTAFRAALDDAKNSLKTSKAEAVNVKTYIKQTIVPSLAGLKGQLSSEGAN